ncbi:FecR domain-containing protein [Antarctobacter heliothermus]|uniref:FecR family protein n=1 Tax=Antarctobacter heliothermus TaxID=74033 RepID=A0A239FY58_9RHOB|nr:FecR domain-containing protein [Antarctobacter heliothermus]SNS61123.1 FecR family protein [Antarctobacter heliothermus]
MHFTKLFLTIALLGPMASGAAAQTSVTCSVETVLGQAEAVTGEVRRSLEPLAQVAIQDRIETAERGLVTLVCPDDLRITVGPSSVVVLVDVDQGATGWGASLSTGIARFARPLFGGARFEVRTPSAVASVRSTVWTIEATAEATAVFVREGQVVVTPVAEAPADGPTEAVLDAGQGVEVSVSDGLGPVEDWGRNRIAQQEARLFPEGQ